MAEWFVAKASELTDGDRRIITAGQREIQGVLHRRRLLRLHNYCLHSGGPACEAC